MIPKETPPQQQQEEATDQTEMERMDHQAPGSPRRPSQIEETKEETPPRRTKLLKEPERAYSLHKEPRKLQSARTSTPGGSSYLASLARRVRETKASSDAAYLKELYHRNDPEEVIGLFESRPSLHFNPSVLAEYIKALIKVDKLDEIELLMILHKVDEKSIGAISTFRNVGRSSKDGILGTTSAPIHMVTAEGVHFKEQLWRTVCSLGMTFLFISGFGALIEDRGIGKGLGLHEEVQSTMESNTKSSDLKGVDEAKAELEEIVHYLRDPKRFNTSWWQASKRCSASWSPWIGKTMLARAIAGEAGVPFFSCSGNEFEEMFFGVGARRVRDLFAAAKKEVLKGEDVDLMIIARGTPGLCVADLANLVNIAAPKAAMDGGKAVTVADLEHAKDKIMMTSERKSTVISPESLGLTTRVVMLLLPCIPMGPYQCTKQLFSHVEWLLGWESEVTSGASNDLQQATNLARAMVNKYGMSKQVGVVTHNYDDNGKNMSTETRLVIEQEIKEFLERAYNNVKTILTTHSKELHALANALLEHETLTVSQKAVLAQVNSKQTW
ncbi:ATP-dependent zinc metalloprotease FTSH 4, mitochondrial [Sesamum alatum]|uniref:ATP-dependent zinc metalloprotease FTSH 4, mitochondrial n=1 Tax=Sesamum alatum TaxID=300844 RepID=A0AAE2C8H6_9LAMI|nr:ATP-dependent zinc metalloprotease FTSH 4, mitochondrial [Sesamum alatum]